MSNIHDPDFINYINQENSYAEAFMRDIKEMQSLLYSEMISRMPSKITTPPQRWGPWLYYQYIPGGKEYPVLCRKPHVMSSSWMDTVLNSFRGYGNEQVLPDWNEIAEKHEYHQITTLLSYTIDTTGEEQFQLQIKDLRNNSILPQARVSGIVSLAWAQDSCTLFYTLCDGKFITVNSNSRTSSEEGTTVHIINAISPQDGPQRFCKRVSGVQYFLEHHLGLFYVLTNAPSSKYKFSDNGYYLATCRDEDARSSNLKDIILPGDDICLEDMDIFNGKLVLFANKLGSPSICSIDIPFNLDSEEAIKIDDLNPWYFPLPSDMFTIVPGSNHDFMNTVYRAVLSSPVTPELLVDYDMSRKTFSIVQQEDVRNVSPDVQVDGSLVWKDFSEKYACEEEEVVSHDGVRIPLTILYSRSAYRKGHSPGLLHGYGAYGEALDKSWCPDRLSLLDRGWMLAFADVRGGAGVDPSWHRSGSGFNKLSSIHDFISCGEYLIGEGIVHQHRLCALGTSAGCLLVGAAINMHPQLFNAVILKVPFLDVLNTLLDPTLPLTTLDYEEFGNPQDQSCFDYILKYSPYDNIPRGVCFPPMLVSASLNDSRVGVWEAAKWVAKIRDITCSNCSSAVILQTSMSGGHFREGGHFSHRRETAYDYAFLIKAMGQLEETI